MPNGLPPVMTVDRGASRIPSGLPKRTRSRITSAIELAPNRCNDPRISVTGHRIPLPAQKMKPVLTKFEV